MSRHELTDWLDAAERRGGSAYACACLLALNGLRVGELCATSVEDLGESTWHHTLTLRASTTKGPQGRGGRVGPAQCPSGHPGRRRSAVGASADQPPRAAHDSLQRRLSCRRAMPRGRVGRRITPHSLRHSAITIALDAGLGLRDVQDFARHEDPKTTPWLRSLPHHLNRHATYAIAQYLAGGN